AGALLVVGVPIAVLLALAAAGSGAAAAQLGGTPLPTAVGGRLLLAAGLVVAAAAAGELLGRGLALLAPRLLAGPAAERLAAAEAHVSVLAGRDRLARELHDSVGHSLSLVSVQAGAARRLLTRDPVAAEAALRAAEDASRRALVDLDHVLGLLREEDGAAPADASTAAAAPVPDLRELADLVGAARAAGVRADVAVRGDVAALPAVVSREAYRILQEGLTNALRHAPAAACRLAVDARGEDLVLEVANTAPGTARGEDPGAGPSGGGRGLVGVRERVRDLRGSVRTGTGPDGTWRLLARLPVRARGGAGAW
ncbi:histidine kinase, partial [Kineococcus sp. T13]|uniref:sensor histidine kinase n=1 Tax=Kineococcus vitellinus TaxID=2696565 RepID=UPI001412D409